MAPRADRGSVAPRALDPILALVERIDRRLRRVQPIGPDSLVALEPHRHRGPPVTLADGTRVGPNDRVCTVHLDNRAVREVADPAWQLEGYHRAREDLAVVADWHRRLPAADRPIAYTGITLLGALARRDGWEVRDRDPTPWVRLQDWYLRSLLVRWSPDGRRRLERGRGPLRTQVVWLSAAELLRRYGPEPPPT